MDVHNIIYYYTFITAGPSDYSDNDAYAAHHVSVAAISLNATGKCNIISLFFYSMQYLHSEMCNISHVVYT